MSENESVADAITRDPDVMHGEPVFRGTRVGDPASEGFVACAALMKILLDECVDVRLRHLFTGHDCQTARYAGMAGLKNGDLLAAAEGAGIDVLVTADQHIPTSRI